MRLFIKCVKFVLSLLSLYNTQGTPLISYAYGTVTKYIRLILIHTTIHSPISQK